MSDRERLGVQDALWLEMDRPNNLMVVDSVIWTAERLDWPQARAVIDERICARYLPFRSRAVRDDRGAWWWEEDTEFSLDDQVTFVDLDDPRDPRALQRVVGEHRSEPLDRRRPLWRLICVEDYRDGSAVVLRTHHAIADGMRMIQLCMTLFDAAPEGGAVTGPGVRQHAAHPASHGSLVERLGAGVDDLGHRAAGTARSALDATRHAAALLGRVPDAMAGTARLAQTALTNPVGVGHELVTGAWTGAGHTAASVRSWLQSTVPGGGILVDVLSAVPGDIDTARKLLLGTRNDTAMWTGTAGVDKAVAWSEPLALDDVKTVARSNHATVNDVLVTCVTGALHAYLAAHGERCASVTFMVPVNLRPFDHTLPDELGNGFALVQLELPTDEPDVRKVLQVAMQRMNRIKHGHEAAIAFVVQDALAGLSRGITEAAVDLLANRSVGTLTNVPGPPEPVYLAGCRVDGMVGWAPLSGDQPMSFTITSYGGRVTVGVACDRGLVPDHELIVEGFGAAFEALRTRSPSVARTVG